MQAPSIRSVGRALPGPPVPQEAITTATQRIWSERHHNSARLDQLHRATQVQTRHLALPLERYGTVSGFQQSNDEWVRGALRLGREALEDALRRAGLGPQDLDLLMFCSVTGIAAPSIDARLINAMSLRRDLMRLPVFGLGCVAGAAGLARVADFLRGAPEGVAALLCVELCSLTLQRADASMPNLIASGLFGDGAAAVVLTGGARAAGGLPRVVASRSVFYPDTERTMGWDVGDSGFRIVLQANVPELVRTHLRDDVDRFLGAHGLSLHDVRHVIAHPGGPKVLEAMEAALDRPRSDFQRTWDSLAAVGNLSSASVLFVLAETIAAGVAQAGDVGLLLAMGPGFCAELVLLRW